MKIIFFEKSSLYFLNLFYFFFTKKNLIKLEDNYFGNIKPDNIQTKNYEEITEVTRKFIYESLKQDVHNKHLINYVKKKYEIGDFFGKEKFSFFDYIVFLYRNNINLSKINTKYIISYYSLVINKHKFSLIIFIINSISYFYYFFKFLLFILKSFFIILSTPISDKISVPDILFLRKKDYPDQNFNRLKKISKRHSYSFDGINIIFSNKKDTSELLYLNYFKNSFFYSMVSLFHSLRSFPFIFYFFISRSIHPGIFYSYLRDDYISKFISNLKCKIFTGILVDKPIFILIDKNKRKQITTSLNESFFYKPLRTFDYVHLDYYFSMNNIDKKMINEFGGEINTKINVPFFRRNIININSSGISNELKQILNNFEKIVLLLPIQFIQKRFTSWNLTDYLNFHNTTINLAKKHSSILFIYKEKKGELSYLTKSHISEMNSLPNVFVVKSSKPRLQNYNQFEDLIKLADSIISMSHTSTTIWQALSYDKFVFAINDSHRSSFLDEYLIETNLKLLSDKFDQWMIRSKDKNLEIINRIKNIVNIQKHDGLIDIYDFFLKYLDTNKNLFKKSVFVYNYNYLNKIQIYFYALLGYKIYYWPSNKITQNIYNNEFIRYPSSSEYFKIKLEAKNQLNKYFKQFESSSDKILLNYFLKYFENKYFRYYMFKYSIQNLSTASNKIKIILSDKFLDNIFNNKYIIKNKFNFFIYLSPLIRQLFNFTYYFIISICTFNKKKCEKILYVRKKVHPCPYLKLLSDEFKKRNVDLDSVFISYDILSSKYNIYFINKFKGSSLNVLSSIISSYSYFAKDYNFLSLLNLNSKDIRYYLVNNFISSSICRLDPKIFLGVFIDEPVFMFLNRYKNTNQFIASLNESFTPAPQLSFDYNCFDIYFAQNEIDSKSINNTHGSIKEKKIIGFYRNFTSHRSSGISNDLNLKISKYDSTILVATINTNNKTYTIWSELELEIFVSKIIEASIKFPKLLFVFKEKKGELGALDNSLLFDLENIDNLFLIRSDNPRLLFINQFEDILHISNLCISMSNYSNTFWQSIYKNIPAISVYFDENKTFMADYDGYEVSIHNLIDNINKHIYDQNFKKKYMLDNKKIVELTLKKSLNPYSIIADKLLQIK